MTMQGMATAVGVFGSREQARTAIEALKDAGFPAEHISLLMPDPTAARDRAEEAGADSQTGATTGAIAGGVLGGLGGWLVGLTALAIPGAGAFIAAGMFLGAGLGAVAGRLVNAGMPEDRAQWYEGEVRAGATLVAVQADGRYAEAQEILRRHGASEMDEAPRREGGSTTLL